MDKYIQYIVNVWPGIFMIEFKLPAKEKMDYLKSQMYNPVINKQSIKGTFKDLELFKQTHAKYLLQ